MAIDDNASYELTGYQVKDLASKIRAKADSNSLASVATSGLYSDLTGAPTIPTVYNGTLTIQQNGTQLGTFSANQSSNTTINITGGGGGGTVVDLYWDYTTSNLYKESSMTNVVSNSEVSQAFLAGDTIYVHDSTNQFEFEVIYQVIAYDSDSYTMTAVSGARIDSYDGNIPDLIIKYTYDYLHTEWTRTVTSLKPFTGATSGAAGSSGLVPAPTTSDPDKFLKGDGTWGTPPNTTYTAGSNISIDANNEISATDTTYSDFTGATSSVAGAHGLVPAPAAGDEAKALHGDGTWKDTTAKLVEMSYGESNAWAKFIAAYNAGSIVYCRASSNANPATGSQTRKAFMAYVNNATSPTNVEFQYVRSQSSKSDSQQTDQVFVYTLTNASGGTWSVASRNMGPKIVAGTGMSSTFTTGANATITLNADTMTGATSGAAGTAGVVPAPAAGDQNKVLKGDGTWVNQGEEFIGEFTTGSSFTLPAGYKIYHIRGFAQYSGASSNAGMYMTRTNRTGTDWLRRINGSAGGVQWGEWSYTDGHFILLGASDALTINGGKVMVDLTITVANSTLWMTSGNFSHSGSQDSGVVFSETTTSDASADTTLQFASTGRTFQAMDIIVTGIKQ